MSQTLTARTDGRSCQCSRVTPKSLDSSIELLAVKLSFLIEGEGQRDGNKWLKTLAERKTTGNLPDPALWTLECPIRLKRLVRRTLQIGYEVLTFR